MGDYLLPKRWHGEPCRTAFAENYTFSPRVRPILPGTRCSLHTGLQAVRKNARKLSKGESLMPPMRKLRLNSIVSPPKSRWTSEKRRALGKIRVAGIFVLGK